MNTIIADQRQSIRQRLSLSLRKYTAVLRVSVGNNLAYIIEVVFRTIFLVVFIFVFEQLWKTTFAIRGITALDGFDINTMIWYLAATETLALSLPQLTRLVLNSAVAFTIALIFVGPPPFTWMGLLAWPLVVFLAASIEYVVYFSIGLLAFWTEETTPFFLIVNRLALVLGGVLAPLEVLPQPIRAISQVLPFSAVLYGPARTLVHFQLDHFGWLLLQQGITLAIGSLVLLAIYWAATRRVNINGG